ncbi:HD domain-containing protein [Sulfitobacter aestuariivivens]|uniref:HD domain-containing protein n=1 Tax=Sulfitobacter aestuariivivens TaxID=2766981 RepID=A0A927D563_9RHOB|nr:HD domain-containing protein [Sulfitobacter aestuariivivens]MBD3663016.1 HD domain-containing protein [Sulfitobacter aestuariivivens]
MSLQAACEAEVTRVRAGQTDGAHDLAHLRRVWSTAQLISGALGQGNLRVIEAAAFLHDIVNPPKDSPTRGQAAAASAAHAAAFLKGLDWADADIKAVAHAIEAHSFSGGVPAETIEAQIVQDADRLDALGALGIARCFNVSGQMGRALFDPEDPLAEGRALDDRAFALDHFETKLFAIAQTLNTAPARLLAQERVAFMKAFREQLMREVT